MISFSQLCELLTSNQRYSWFYMLPELLTSFSEDELKQVVVEECNDGYLRFWYPKDKYQKPVEQPKQYSKAELDKMMIDAAMKGDQAEVLRISALLEGK